MSGDAPSECKGLIFSQMVHAKVSDWLNIRDGSTNITSGIGSTSASAICAEELDLDLPASFFPEKDETSISKDSVQTQRRHSF